MVGGGGGWWVVCNPILVFSLSLNQAVQQAEKKVSHSEFDLHTYILADLQTYILANPLCAPASFSLHILQLFAHLLT